MAKKRRLIRRSSDNIQGVASPLMNRLYSGRGISQASELEYDLAHLLPPNMRGLKDASALLGDAVVAAKQILIVGDFDADGATSSVLMVSALRAMGCNTVDYLVPNRFDYGYGLTPEIVEVAREFNPALIVTVDNGISSIEGVARANRLGIDVLITDHHLPGDEMPAAAAIVNPNQPSCTFASKSLAGVGVAFYLLSGVRRWLGESGWFEHRQAPNLADYLDLVALGTIADVVPLDQNNRILVNEGIRRIRAGRARAGINALLQFSGSELKDTNTRDLAFGVGPRLNAAGRLVDMSIGIECLLAASDDRAAELAGVLNEINSERKEIEQDMKQQAEAALASVTEGQQSRVGICLEHDDWHQGVVGIIASRIKDKLHRPVIAFAKVSETELKGSARSIRGFHIRDALDAIATRNPGLLSKFGGHAMAAGLSLAVGDLAKFSEEFDNEARSALSEAALENTLLSDGEIDDVNLQVAIEVVSSAPWGQGFPEPVFDGMFEVIEQRIVGERHLKLKLRPITSQQIIPAIAFNHPFLLEQRELRLAYRLDINRYRGLTSVQLIVEDTSVALQ
ncbi:MAG: single-stranded-DNA-specific exonuclease RecJ [Pseudomonadales bacterium]|nr:single-stranded-DNA-specific exonuclease RecJ [Pseudomonadales bacterium]